MAAAYNVHAGVVGPVEGIPHLVALLDATPSRALRQHLLLLLEALVAPSCLAASAGTATSAEAAGTGLPPPPPAGQEAAARAAHANGVALLEAGGVQLMVDLVAAAHEASDRPVVALQTNLIAASSHAEEAREWFYWKPQAAGAAGSATGTAGQPQAGTEEGRVGPVSKAEVRQLYRCVRDALQLEQFLPDQYGREPAATWQGGQACSKPLRRFRPLCSSGTITGTTFFWAAGMAEPLPLAAVRELRWWVAHRQGPLSAFEAAAAALRVLQVLADQQPAVDAHGEVLFPLPLAHRLMASPACLPHLAQVVLTGDPALVSAACALLLTVLRHNADGLAVLYRTGIQFFLLVYCGSNLREAARLLKACHLSSASAEALAAAAAGRPLAQRSILGGLLPESLLHILESYGPDQFAAALVGDSDTPELIWTHRMRLERLVPQMLRHLGDFPRRLRECSHAVYEYTPCPPVGYPEIEGEVFCHRYYLKHMCDEQRHAGWPLADHVQLLQASHWDSSAALLCMV
jgi:DnaJ family protein C protein 13